MKQSASFPVIFSALLALVAAPEIVRAQALAPDNVTILNQLADELGSGPVQGTRDQGSGPCVVDVSVPNNGHKDLLLRVYNGPISKAVPDSAIWLSLSPFADLTEKSSDKELLVQSMQPVKDEDSELEVASSVKITLRDDGSRLFSIYILNSSTELPGPNQPQDQPLISKSKFTQWSCILP